MRSELFFKYAGNGNLTELATSTDRLFAGQVATAEYRLYVGDDGISSPILIGDSVFIRFERNSLTADRLMSFDGDLQAWVIMSNGWETAFEPAEIGTDIKISFIVRRYSTAVAGKLVTTFTTEQKTVKVYPSGQFEAPDLADSVADDIFETLASHTAQLVDHENRISNIEDGNPIVDFTTDLAEGLGIKYYLDGSTATVPLPSGGTGEPPEVVPVSEITFIEDNWILSLDGDYEIAFSNLVTGRTNTRYSAEVDEAAVDGFIKSNAGVLKGSDGSILLYGVTEPFAGRVLLNGVSGTGEIDTITRNGVLLPIVDRSVNIEVPTTASEIIFDGSDVETAILDFNESLAETDAIARGRLNALVFDNVAQLTDWINGTYSRPDSVVVGDLVVGQNLYIKVQEEPDYWVRSLPVTAIGDLTELPTDKIDLSNYIDKTTAQPISGVKTFTALPQSSVVPTDNKDLVNKKYVDDSIIGVGGQTIYDLVISSQAEFDAMIASPTWLGAQSILIEGGNVYNFTSPLVVPNSIIEIAGTKNAIINIDVGTSSSVVYGIKRNTPPSSENSDILKIKNFNINVIGDVEDNVLYGIYSFTDVNNIIFSVNNVNANGSVSGIYSSIIEPLYSRVSNCFGTIKANGIISDHKKSIGIHSFNIADCVLRADLTQENAISFKAFLSMSNCRLRGIGVPEPIPLIKAEPPFLSSPYSVSGALLTTLDIILEVGDWSENLQIKTLPLLNEYFNPRIIFPTKADWQKYGDAEIYVTHDGTDLIFDAEETPTEDINLTIQYAK